MILFQVPRPIASANSTPFDLLDASASLKTYSRPSEPDPNSADAIGGPDDLLRLGLPDTVLSETQVIGNPIQFPNYLHGDFFRFHLFRHCEKITAGRRPLARLLK